MLPVRLVLARPECATDCNLLVERVALRPFDDVDRRGLLHEFTENLFHRRYLVAEVGCHDLQCLVVDPVNNIAVDNDVVGLPIGDFRHPAVHVDPALPQPFLEMVLPNGIAFVADKIRWPQAHGASDMEVAENQNEPVGSFHN